jgi:glycosyltransferase involved in cell wall biosynthesis
MLTEHVTCFPKRKSIAGKLLSHLRWQRYYRKAVRRYIKEHGKPDIVHVHIPMRAGIIALWIKRRFNIPFIITEHWGIYNDTERLNYTGRSRIFKDLTIKIFSKAAAFTSVSHYLGRGVNQQVMKMPYTVIPNVADTKLFRPGKEPGLPFRFIHVSNMVPLKNVEGIINAFALLTRQGIEAELVLIGDRDPALRDLAENAGLAPGKIVFRGEISYDAVAREMQEAACLLLFSDIENAPCVISEAHCCGLPVIATAVGGIPEMVNASNGMLVNPRDEKALADAMKDMIENYQRFDRNQIARNASAIYSYEAVGSQLAVLYEAHSRT